MPLTSPDSTLEAGTDHLKTRYLAMYRWMLLARVFEERLTPLYKSGRIIGGVFLGRGQEALSAALGVNLRKTDIFAPLIRDQAGRLAFGDTLLDSARTYFGSRLGPMQGRDGNIHRGKPREGYYAMISHLGAMVSTVTGGLMARRFKGDIDFVGATCIGDGGTSTGSFHEGLNAAAVEKLPLVVVVANNQYAYSTCNSRQYACEDLIQRAAGYGVKGYKIDGTNPRTCLETLTEAVATARAGGGPQMVVADLLRLVGHGEHDPFSYVSHALKVSPIGRDCVEVARQQILEEGWATEQELAALRKDAQEQTDAACSQAMSEPAPDPRRERWMAISTTSLCEGNV